MRAFPKLVGFVYFLLTCMLGWSALEGATPAEPVPGAQQTAALEAHSDSE